MKQPRVTIAIPCYNYAIFIEDAIRSASEQSYENIDILVVNDGSTDNSNEVIKDLENSYNFRYITQENKGIIATRNTILKESIGEFLIQLDADDYLDSDYVAKTVEYAQKHNLDIVYTDVKKFEQESDQSNFPEYNFNELINHNYIHISSLIRLSSVKDVKFDPSLDRMTHEDWDFFLHLCLNGARAKKLSSTYLNYRIHGESARNNRALNIESRRRYIDMYAYVIRKYEHKFPDKVYYLSGNEFANWFVEVDEARTNEISARNSLKKTTADYVTRTENMTYRQFIKYCLLYTKSRVMMYKDRLFYVLGDEYYRRYPYLKEVTICSPGRERKAAVIVHLYHTDQWSTISSKLNKIKLDYDLFVTIPNKNIGFIDTIKSEFQYSRIFIAPNKGRDVLPFIEVMKLISKSGQYEYILKLHSKKSPHRNDGGEWFSQILDGLMPDNLDYKNLERNIINSRSSVIGPNSEYYPLSVNFPSNYKHVKKIMSDIYGHQTCMSEVILGKDDLGFFAGTMFWANVASLASVIEYCRPWMFEKEAGQVDGTFAHAIERVFSIAPEMDGRNILVVGSNGSVYPREYKSNNIPNWSSDHDQIVI